MDVKDLLRKYAAGQRRFVQASLRGTNLVGSYLVEINLSRANLTEANLSRANLSQAVLVKANLTRANLRGANLAGVDLRQANLTGAEIALEGLQPDAYAGAILPDGSRSELPDQEPQPVAVSAARIPAFSRGMAGPVDLELDTEAKAGSPSVHLRPHRRSAQPLWQQLPWLQLAAWGVGYGFLGLVLICLQADIWAWPLVWLSSLLWGWRQNLLRSQPLIAAVTVILVTGLSWLGAGLGGLLWGLGAIGLRLTGYGWERALELGGWLGGTGCLTVAVLPLLLSRQPALEVAIASTPPLAVMILLGLLLTYVGISAHHRLQALHLAPGNIALSLGAAAILGLALGSCMGLLALGLA